MITSYETTNSNYMLGLLQARGNYLEVIPTSIATFATKDGSG
ncbi:hypothetical protein [Pedobacter sp. SYSU D00535]|nr:hypothetical protein [Pedobacter sp. SYSU D00535]